MYSKTLILMLFLLIELKILNSNELENIKAIDSEVGQYYKNLNKKKGKDEVICFDDIDCFNRDGPLKHVGLLPESPDKIKTRFVFYNNLLNKEYELNPKQIESLSVVSQNQYLIIIIHGFGNNIKKSVLVALKDSLIKSANITNIIMVDWSKGAASPWYLQAMTNTQVVGRQIAFLVNELTKYQYIDPYFVHIIGHSLGAQVSHFAGEYFQIKYKREIGRITALDAAAPLFEGFNGSHLNKMDALFVDAIHTSCGYNIIRGEVGFIGEIGDIDFYPNNGKGQPHCKKASGPNCDHNAAVDYMDASVKALNECSLIAYKCDSWAEFYSGNCSDKIGLSAMGFPSVSSLSRGKHYLKTSDKFPFCWDTQTNNTTPIYKNKLSSI